MVFTIKSSAAELSDTPSTVSNANRVLLQYTGTGEPIVTIKSDDTFQPGSAAVQGSVMVAVSYTHLTLPTTPYV